MIYTQYIIVLLEILVTILPILLVVAFVTVAERKTMASMQRRLGPNIVGYYGLLQAFADALKLLLKEYVSPTQANLILFFLGPILTLIFSLLGFAVVPFGPGLCLFDFNMSILYMLAVSSLATYGILLAGWSANSKYAFLGALRSTAQLISYELVLTSAIFLIILLSGSLNLTANIEMQRAVWFALPLLPIFVIFFISAIAETNRAPFDLAEAESELVSGFMTEHSAVIFVFFFLAEYASIILICILIAILFIGGYIFNFGLLIYLLDILDLSDVYLSTYVDHDFFTYGNYDKYNYYKVENKDNDLDLFDYNIVELIDYNINTFGKEISNYKDISLNIVDTIESYLNNFILQDILHSFTIAIKSFIMVFAFIWVRASFPRVRFDQLMSYCWTVLLPLIFAFILTIIFILYSLRLTPNNVLFS